MGCGCSRGDVSNSHLEPISESLSQVRSPISRPGDAYRTVSLSCTDSSSGGEDSVSPHSPPLTGQWVMTSLLSPSYMAPSPKKPLLRHTALTFRLPLPPAERPAPVPKASVPRGIPFARPAAGQSRSRPPLSPIATAPPQTPGAGGCFSPRQCGGTLLLLNAPLPGFPDPPLATAG
eukprot:EG_transcript_6794